MTDERRNQLQGRIWSLSIEKQMNLARYKELQKLADEQIAQILKELEGRRWGYEATEGSNLG